MVEESAIFTFKNKLMGVMACSRKNCESVETQTYVSDVGYICNSCQTEFKKYLKIENKSPKTNLEITTDLQIFMESEKNTYFPKRISVNEFFKLNRYK